MWGFPGTAPAWGGQGVNDGGCQHGAGRGKGLGARLLPALKTHGWALHLFSAKETNNICAPPRSVPLTPPWPCHRGPPPQTPRENSWEHAGMCREDLV